MQHARRRTVTGGWETGLLLVALVAAAPQQYPGHRVGDAGARAAGGRAVVETLTRAETQAAVSIDASVEAPRAPVHSSPRSLYHPVQVPARAQQAYDFAASVMTAVDPACSLSPTLLAAIGGVESDHGRAGEAVLRSDGTSVPVIRGPVLNGTGGLGAVVDTDAGELDGNERWDRAMGPMQLLPAVWRYAGVDADEDGWRTPYDIDDAALAAGVLLCAGDGSLATPTAMRRAVRRYNPSPAYVAAVLGLERIYRERGGATVAPVAPVAVRAAPPVVISTTDPRQRDTQPPAPPRTRTDTPEPPPSPPSGPEPTPASPPAPSTNPSPTTSASPSASPSPSSSTSPSTSPSPSPSATSAVRDLGGVLTSTGEHSWACGSEPVDFGDPEWLAAGSTDDLDGDGAAETRLDELRGLEGEVVTLAVATDSAPPRVLRVNGVEYLFTTP